MPLIPGGPANMLSLPFRSLRLGHSGLPAILIACIAGIHVAGCLARPVATQPAGPATGGQVESFQDPDTATNAVAEPAVLAAPSEGMDDIRKYRIAPGDIVHVQVRGEADLTDDFKVAPDGTIVFGFLGRVAVAGLSVAGVESNLTALLAKDYLVDPKVYVQVKSSVLRRVIVFGEVKSPGIYDMPVGERFSLLQVIARAGGPTELAATDRVRIVRRTDGAEKTIKINVTDLLKGGSSGNDLELRPNDVVIVPQTVF